jgi:hypothetical protein
MNLFVRLSVQLEGFRAKQLIDANKLNAYIFHLKKSMLRYQGCIFTTYLLTKTGLRGNQKCVMKWVNT